MMKLLATACEKVFDKILGIYGGNLHYHEANGGHGLSQSKHTENRNSNQIYEKLFSQMRKSNKGYI